MSNDTKRVFVAIRLPDFVIAKISHWVEEARKTFGSQSIRFLNPETWHITLVFLGEQNADSIDKIISSMDEVVRQQKSFEIKLDRAVYGPNEYSPRMIWLGGDAKSNEILSSIQKRLMPKFLEHGVNFEPENRAFSTHITLARFSSRPKVLPKLACFEPISFIASGVELVESHLLPQGAEYTTLKVFKFSV